MAQQIERIDTLSVADLVQELLSVKTRELWVLLLPFSYGPEAEDHYLRSFCGGAIRVDYARRLAASLGGAEMYVCRATFCDRLVGVEFDRVYVPASGLEAEEANKQYVSLSAIPSVLKFCHGRVIAYDSITARAKEGTNAE